MRIPLLTIAVVAGPLLSPLSAQAPWSLIEELRIGRSMDRRRLAG